MAQKTVKVGTQEVLFGRPRSITIVLDVIRASTQNEMRGAAACLGIAWECGGSPDQPAKWSQAKCDPLAFGGMVIDTLMARGVELVDIMQAGEQAFLFLAEKLPTPKGVEQAEKNSEAPEAGAP